MKILEYICSACVIRVANELGIEEALAPLSLANETIELKRVPENDSLKLFLLESTNNVMKALVLKGLNAKADEMATELFKKVTDKMFDYEKNN